MSVTEPSLDALRRDIDRIDDAIHDLLMQRCEVVERIAEVKGTGPAFMRPGREATILRRLVDRHGGRFPIPVLIRIWREMLAAFTLLQGPFAVAVYAPEDERGLWDMARDMYGSSTPMMAVNQPMPAVRAVFDGTATVAVVPWPDDRDGEPWWRALMSEDAKTPRVIAHLPFVVSARGNGRKGLAIARIPHEPTGDDHTLVAIELTEPVSRSRLKEALEDAGLPPVAFWNGPEREADSPVHLVEVTDFVGADDARLGQLVDRLGFVGRRAVPIGGFAMPIVVDESGAEARPA